MKKVLVIFALIVAPIMSVTAFAQDGYIDLGLSSETKWKNVNAKGHYTYYEAMELFRDKLPTYEQWEELRKECKWTWVKGSSAEKTGYRVIGPNGRSIFLPAAGCSLGGKLYSSGKYGAYWLSTFYGETFFNYDKAFGMAFFDGFYDVQKTSCFDNLSVRLVKD